MPGSVRARRATPPRCHTTRSVVAHYDHRPAVLRGLQCGTTLRVVSLALGLINRAKLRGLERMVPWADQLQSRHDQYNPRQYNPRHNPRQSWIFEFRCRWRDFRSRQDGLGVPCCHACGVHAGDLGQAKRKVSASRCESRQTGVRLRLGDSGKDGRRGVAPFTAPPDVLRGGRMEKSFAAG